MSNSMKQQEEATLTSLSASELARRIAAGRLSSQQVVEAHIRRIEAVNPRLNALVVPLFEQARQDANRADRLREQGTLLGPLHGVPVTLKEQYMVAGTPATVGLMSHRSQLAEQEGPLVQRLREAGAIILGKTNASQLLMSLSGSCDNPVYGRTNNPWNLARTPGGSSGGEAAIIAAGGSPLGLGADSGGSIRVPAHFCGLYSLLPTARRLTNLDTPPYAEVAGQEAIIAQPCPIARSAQDLRLVMSILAAPGLNALDPSVPPVPWPDPTAVSPIGLRIGVYTESGAFSVAPAVRRGVEEAAQILRTRGALVEPWTPPDVAGAGQLYVGLVSADGFATLRRILGDDPPEHSIGSTLQALPAAVSVDQYWQLVDKRNQYRHRFLAALDAQRFDALLCPAYPLPALTHDSPVSLNLAASSNATLCNLLGLPAGVAPITRVHSGEESDRGVGNDSVEQAARAAEMNSAGLPVGVQVVARPWREDIVLALMEALEEHTDVSVPTWEGSQLS
jgi:fatty acid amide hydrolase